MQTYNQPGAVTPQQLGFQPLGAAASGAPPPMLMPGQSGYQQPFGYSVSPQQYPQQQYPQQMQQYPQQCPVQFPMSQPYGGPQYPQGSYSAPVYNQAPPMYNQAAPMYNQAAPMYNQAAPMYNQAVPAYGYAQPGAVGYQGQPHSQGFNMGSGLMGFGAGAVTGAALDHMFTGSKHNSHGNYGGGGHQHGHH
ncbi:hypothetical protein ABBQ38_014260 [Trebouxia sp. C0009 RCD-2024]